MGFVFLSSLLAGKGEKIASCCQNFDLSLFMNTAKLLIEALEQEKVQYIFALPGEETLELVEAIRSSSIRLVVVRHEQEAGFMAATIGRLTGCPGVCLTTLGPGVTNIMTAVAYAQLGAMPMILLTGQKPIKQQLQGKFQLIDTVKMLTPITKMSTQVTDGRLVPALVREAFRFSQQERPGVVHIELPEDIAREERCAPLLPFQPLSHPKADRKMVEQAAKLIAAAKRPLLLIGANANRKRISQALKHFIDRTGLPFVTTQMGKGVLDERSDHYLGTVVGSPEEPIYALIEQADLIVNIGHDSVEKPPFSMKKSGFKVIHINFSAAQINPIYFPQLDVVGDIAHTLIDLETLLNLDKGWHLNSYENFTYHLPKKKEKEEESSFLTPKKVVEAVRRAMPEDAVLCLDNGLYKISFARYYTTYAPHTLLLDNALATMGAGLPSAMAVKLHFPNKKVMALLGDGGFMMNSQALETAKREKIHLVILLLVDNGYGMIRKKQQQHKLPDYGMSFSNPDFVRYAEAYGVRGYRYKKGPLYPLVKRLIEKEEGIHLLTLPIHYLK